MAALIKFLKKKHVDSFVDAGVLHMETFAYFRCMEETNPGRGDKFEGADRVVQTTDFSIFTPDDVPIPFRPGSAELKFDDDDPYTSNVFCMSLLPLGEPLDDRFHEFGDCAVIITDPFQFVDRVKACLPASYNGKVEYVPDDFSGELKAFRKRERYSWQREWRIVCTSGSGGLMRPTIGSLNDIAKVYSVD